MTAADDILQDGGTLLTMRQANKWLDGRKIINMADLTIKKGRIIGVVGDNGYGKTVLLKMMAGLMEQDSGEIVRYTKEISLVLSGRSFYPWMRVMDALKYYRDFYDDFDINRAQQLIGESALEPDRKIRLLSTGQQERLCLILALARNSRLYLMDEPLNGIDPPFKKDFKKFLLANLPEDASVVMATHLLKELEYLFDEVLFVTRYGIRQMETEEIREKYHQSVEDYYMEVVRCEKV